MFPKARQAVEKALELDGSLAEAHGTLAYILAYYDWNWAEAEKEFETRETPLDESKTIVGNAGHSEAYVVSHIAYIEFHNLCAYRAHAPERTGTRELSVSASSIAPYDNPSD